MSEEEIYTNKTIDPMSLKEDEDYQFVNINNEVLGVSFGGLTFTIDDVRVEDEVEEGDDVKMSFSYSVMDYDGEVSDEYEQKLGAIIEKLVREEASRLENEEEE